MDRHIIVIAFCYLKEMYDITRLKQAGDAAAVTPELLEQAVGYVYRFLIVAALGQEYAEPLQIECRKGEALYAQLFDEIGDMCEMVTGDNSSSVQRARSRLNESGFISKTDEQIESDIAFVTEQKAEEAALFRKACGIIFKDPDIALNYFYQADHDAGKAMADACSQGGALQRYFAHISVTPSTLAQKGFYAALCQIDDPATWLYNLCEQIDDIGSNESLLTGWVPSEVTQEYIAEQNQYLTEFFAGIKELTPDRSLTPELPKNHALEGVVKFGKLMGKPRDIANDRS